MTSLPLPHTSARRTCRRLMPAIAVATGAAVLLAGCSATEAATPPPQCAAPHALVIVVSVHQGAAKPSLPAAAACDVESALRAGAPISIVSAEGTPRVLMKSAKWTLNDGQPESSNPQASGDDLSAARAAV